MGSGSSRYSDGSDDRVDAAHSVVANDPAYALHGKALWVDGSGRLTRAQVQIPQQWLSRLRHAGAMQRRMELRLSITCERAQDAQQELRQYAHAQGDSRAASRTYGGHKWPRSVYLDSAGEHSHARSGQTPLRSPMARDGVVRTSTGWDPESTFEVDVSGSAAAVRYEYELSGEPLDGVVTLRVLPSMVQHWGALDGAVQLTFVGDWGWGGSCVRVRATVWERVALPESFRPELDARHRCEVDGSLVCQMGPVVGQGGRHFEDVPLDEFNYARAERLALAYSKQLAVRRGEGMSASQRRAEQEELRRVLAENAARDAERARAQSSPFHQSQASPRDVYVERSPQSSPHIELEIARLEANVERLRTPHAQPQSSPRQSPLAQTAEGTSSFSRKGSARKGVIDLPLASPSNHHMGASFAPFDSPPRSARRDSPPRSAHLIRVEAATPISSRPPSPPRASPRESATIMPRGRLAPLSVHTGETGGAPSSTGPFSSMHSQLQPPPSALARRPLLSSPQNSLPLTSTHAVMSDDDPFKAHYAPEVYTGHAPPGSVRGTPARPPLTSQHSVSSGVHFFAPSASPYAVDRASGLPLGSPTRQHPISQLTNSAGSGRFPPNFIPTPKFKEPRDY